MLRWPALPLVTVGPSCTALSKDGEVLVRPGYSPRDCRTDAMTPKQIKAIQMRSARARVRASSLAAREAERTVQDALWQLAQSRALLMRPIYPFDPLAPKVPE